MSYARNLLSRGEEVVYEIPTALVRGGRPHVGSGSSSLIVALAIVIFLVDRTSGRSASETVDGVLTIVALSWPSSAALGLHRLRGVGLAQPGVAHHHAPGDPRRGRAQQERHRHEPREDQRRAPRPERLRPDLRVRHPRHPHRGRGGRRQQHLRLPDDRRPGRLQEGDVRPEDDAREPGARAAALPAPGTGAGHAARRADAPARRVRPRRRVRGRVRAPRRPTRRRAAATAGTDRRPEAARSPADDLGATLERLADLRDKGLITPEEYEAKKRDLLERM